MSNLVLSFFSDTGEPGESLVRRTIEAEERDAEDFPVNIDSRSSQFWTWERKV